MSLSSTHGEAAGSYEIQGYVHGVEILSPTSPLKNYYLKVHASNNLTLTDNFRIFFFNIFSDARIPLYNYLLMNQVPQTLMKNLMECGALLVERLIMFLPLNINVLLSCCNY